MMSRYEAQGIETEFERGSRGRVFGLRPDDGYFPRCRLLRVAAARLVALKWLTMSGPSFAKGWRMPSIAEDDLTDIHRLFLRNTGSRR